MSEDTDSTTAQAGHGAPRTPSTTTPWRARSACGCSCSPRCCCSARCSSATRSISHEYQRDFRTASHELDKLVGAANTVILLTSSLTMALSIAALARGRKRRALGLMAVTVLCALMFMGIKAYEWGHKFEHGIYPTSTAMLARPAGEQVFYGLYFTMTGLHALHVVAGATAILVTMRLVAKERVHRRPDGVSRERRPVLAPGGRDVDLPVPVVLPDRVR